MNDHPASLVPAFDSKVTLEDSHLMMLMMAVMAMMTMITMVVIKKVKRVVVRSYRRSRQRQTKVFFARAPTPNVHPPSTYTNTIYLVIPQPKHGLQC